MQLDSRSTSLLGWDELLERLAGLALTPMGAAACRRLQPVDDAELLEWRQRRLRELDQLLNEGQQPPLEALEEVSADLERASKDGVLDGEAIRRVARAMVVTSRLRRYLLQHGHRVGGALTEMARGTHNLQALGRDLLQAFDSGGQLRDSASAELGPLRRQARALAEGLRKRLEDIMRRPTVARCLSDSYITQRNDRYVLPVRADAPHPVPGIVHDTSQSGATLFVEPAELVDWGNRLKLARAAVAEHELRILAGFSREIGEQAPALAANLECLANFEVVWAAQKLKTALAGWLPRLAGGDWRLEAARHPLLVLAGEAVVANNLRLTEHQRCLVISGPNAGGKTVALKTIGLTQLMAQAGLAPAVGESTQLPIFDRVFVVLGDDQDLQRGLSSFSAHLEQLRQIVDSADARSLVLIDEIAAGTEPGHGAALAEALLHHLVEYNRCRVVVTTHFEQLKQLAYQDDRFANASVGFDSERLQPTFNLHPDIPGRSLTFEIAARLGLEQSILTAAESCLHQDEQRLERMLTSLERERQALAATRQQLQRRQDELQQQFEQHHEQQQQLEQRRRQLLQAGRGELLGEIRQARRQAATLIERLRSRPDMPTAVAVSQQLKLLERHLLEQSAAEDTAGTAAPQLRAGDRVRLKVLGGEGTVLGLDSRAGMVTVGLGVMRTRVPVEQVEKLPPAIKTRRRPGPGPVAVSPPPKEIARSPDNTVDLRGLRTDEAVARLDGFLDDLFARGIGGAFVVHGHGTGALRQAVRTYLAESPYVAAFRAGDLEEGGDGVTVVKLK